MSNKKKKIRPVGGAELFHEDGQTDGRTNKRTGMTKLTMLQKKAN
jgi:hypothetical protein